jgi:hypothetical protein
MQETKKPRCPYPIYNTPDHKHFTPMYFALQKQENTATVDLSAGDKDKDGNPINTNIRELKEDRTAVIELLTKKGASTSVTKVAEIQLVAYE